MSWFGDHRSILLLEMDVLDFERVEWDFEEET